MDSINHITNQVKRRVKGILVIGLLSVFLSVSDTVLAQVVSTFAGSGFQGNVDGAGTSASFYGPTGVAADKYGNLYVSDLYNNKIRKITPSGVVTTLAGSGVAGSADGTGASASFDWPYGIAVSNSGVIYVADYKNHKIRKITPSGIVTTLAGSGTAGSTDGIGSSASFNYPCGLAIDKNENVYVADRNNNKIRKITSSGEVSTLAGSGSSGSTDGIGTAASFYFPCGVAVDYSNSVVYVTDQYNHKIRKITSSGEVSTLAGTGNAGSTDGTGTIASFYLPIGIAVDKYGHVYISDTQNNKIRKIFPNGLVSTFAGSGIAGSLDGTVETASFNKPIGIAADGNGLVYIADIGNNKIRKIGDCFVYTVDTITACKAYKWIDGVTYYYNNTTSKYTLKSSSGCDSIVTLNLKINKSVTPFGGVVSTFAGSGSIGNAEGQGTEASFNNPLGIAIDKSGNVFVADRDNHKIRKITPNGFVSTFAGSGNIGDSEGIGVSASFNNPSGVAVDTNGNIYVADQGNHKIRKITSSGVVSTLAGFGSPGGVDANGTLASFNSPTGIAIDNEGNLYVTDKDNNKIRKVTQDGTVTTLAGSGEKGDLNSKGTSASFNYPSGIAADKIGNIYVADRDNHKIRKITKDGSVSTYAGFGISGDFDGESIFAGFGRPTGIAVDKNGILYVTDSRNNKIKQISRDRIVTTIIGKSSGGNIDGNGTIASFQYPEGVAMDRQGNLYVIDKYNYKIRKIEDVDFIFNDLSICKSQNEVDLSRGIPNLTFNGNGMKNNDITFDPLFSGVGSHNIEAKFIDSFGCEFTDNFNIEVKESPNTPEIVRLSSDQIATDKIYPNYQWYRNGFEIEGERNQILKVNELGLYSVEVNNNEECYATSESYSFGIDKQHDNVLKKEDILVYPNPTTGVLYVEFFNEDVTHNISITSSLGEQLLSLESESRVVKIDISDFASGTYNLNVTSNSINTAFKINKF